MPESRTVVYLDIALDVTLDLYYIRSMKRQPKPTMVTLRPTDDDWKLITWFCDKLGVGPSQVIRIALRKWYETEKSK